MMGLDEVRELSARAKAANQAETGLASSGGRLGRAIDVGMMGLDSR